MDPEHGSVDQSTDKPDRQGALGGCQSSERISEFPLPALQQSSICRYPLASSYGYSASKAYDDIISIDKDGSQDAKFTHMIKSHPSQRLAGKIGFGGEYRHPQWMPINAQGASNDTNMAGYLPHGLPAVPNHGPAPPYTDPNGEPQLTKTISHLLMQLHLFQSQPVVECSKPWVMIS